jgi:hypothetical protein
MGAESTSSDGDYVKICTICRQDCSGVPRLKNAAGEYACKACMAKRVEEAAAERLAADLARPSSDGKPKDGALSKRAKVATMSRSGRARACANCGYDLSGLESKICPECATVNSESRSRSQWDEETTREVARAAFRAPCIMLVGSLVGGAALAYSNGGAQMFLGWLIGLGISYVVGMVVVLLCTFTWLGHTTALPLLALQVASIHGLLLAMVMFLVAINSPLMFWFGLALVYSLMFERMTDTDGVNSWIVGLLVMAAHFVPLYFLRLYMVLA